MLRARYALRLMGPSICGGMVTTVGAAAFLWSCKVALFVQFGVFVVYTLIAAFVFATMVGLSGWMLSLSLSPPLRL